MNPAAPPEREDLEMPDAPDLEVLALQLNNLKVSQKTTSSDRIRGIPLKTLLSNTHLKIPWTPRDRLIMKSHLARHKLHMGNYDLIGLDDLITRLDLGGYCAQDSTYKAMVVRKLNGALEYALKKCAEGGHVVLSERPSGGRWMSWTEEWSKEGWNGDESVPEEEEEEEEEVDLEVLGGARIQSSRQGQHQPAVQQGFQGTHQPVHRPAVQPMQTFQTFQQTEQHQPSVQQGFQRTHQPVQQPFIQPVQQQVIQPIHQPTIQPTHQPTIQPSSSIQQPHHHQVPQPTPGLAQSQWSTPLTGETFHTAHATTPQVPHTEPTWARQDQQPRVPFTAPVQRTFPPPVTLEPPSVQRRLFQEQEDVRFERSPQRIPDVVAQSGVEYRQTVSEPRVRTSPREGMPARNLSDEPIRGGMDEREGVTRLETYASPRQEGRETSGQDMLASPRQEVHPRQEMPVHARQEMSVPPRQEVHPHHDIHTPPRQEMLPSHRPDMHPLLRQVIQSPRQELSTLLRQQAHPPDQPIQTPQQVSLPPRQDLHPTHQTPHPPHQDPRPRQSIHPQEHRRTSIIADALDLALHTQQPPRTLDLDHRPRRVSISRPSSRGRPFQNGSRARSLSASGHRDGFPPPLRAHASPAPSIINRIFPSDSASNFSTPPHRIISLPGPLPPRFSPPPVPLTPHPYTSSSTPIQNTTPLQNATPTPNNSRSLHRSLTARTVVFNNRPMSQVDVYQEVVTLVVYIRTYERVSGYEERVDRARGQLGVVLGFLPGTSLVAVSARVWLGSERDLRGIGGEL